MKVIVSALQFISITSLELGAPISLPNITSDIASLSTLVSLSKSYRLFILFEYGYKEEEKEDLNEKEWLYNKLQELYKRQEELISDEKYELAANMKKNIAELKRRLNEM